MNKSKCASTCPLRAEFTPALADDMCKICHIKTINKNTVVHQNAFPSVVYFIFDGLGMEFCSFSEGEKNVSLGLIKKGEFFGLSLFAGEVPPFDEQDRSLQFLTDSVCCIFSPAAIRDINSNHAELHNFLTNCHTNNQVNSITHLMNLATFNSEEKIAYLLNILRENGISLEHITQDSMAQILNINRYTITKTLHKVLSNM